MRRRNLMRTRNVLLVLCVLMASAAQADDTDPFGGRALKPGEQHAGKVMTVDELVVCIDLKRDLDSKKREADGLEIQADIAESGYRGLSQIINAERQFLDNTDQREIDAFNAKVREHGAAVDAYNTLVVSFNQALSDHDALAKRFNAQCTSTYYASDLNKAYSIRAQRLAESMDKAVKQDGKPER
jgi:hypothetical protein